MAANTQGRAWSSDWLGLFIAKLIIFRARILLRARECPRDHPPVKPYAQVSVCGRSQLSATGAVNTRAHLPRCSKLSHHNTSLTRCH